MNINDCFGFEELEVWKKAREIKIEIFGLINSFPAEEQFRLTDQIKRSSRSIPALIAEGHGRFSYPDQIHYCVQARGSLSETMNHLIDAFDRTYITNEILKNFRIKLKLLDRLLNGYIKYLGTKKENK
ncbi:MAG: four helix bundle protein [Parafilimonas sp.]